MSVSPPERIEIDSDPSALADAMADVIEKGGGWLNILPEIPEDIAVPATPNALAIFSKRGPIVPLATWTAPSQTRKGLAEPTEIGLQHGASKRAQVALEGTPGAIPGDWRVLSDNPRRGAVVQPTPDATLAQQSEWILQALTQICVLPKTGTFMVFVYRS